MRPRSLTSGIVAVLTLAAGTSASSYDHSRAVQALGVLGVSAEPHACATVLIASTAVVASAQCVMTHVRQLLSDGDAWVAFGFALDAYADAGSFNETERIAVREITFDPVLDATRVIGNDTGLLSEQHDWAVLTLAHAPSFPKSSVVFPEEVGEDLQTQDSVLPLHFLDEAVDGIAGIARYYGFDVLYIDHETLDITTSDVVAIMESMSDCVATNDTDTTAQLTGAFVCVARADLDDNRPLPSKLNAWSILTFSTMYLEQGYFIGFGTRRGDASDATQSFSWAEAAGPEFFGKPLLNDTQWDVWKASTLLGDPVPQLADNMKFLTGIRETRKGANYCGGSLVTPTFVLTAAHCIDGGEMPWVSIGSLAASGSSHGEQIRVARAIVHPHFDKMQLANDLALLELKYPSIEAPVALFNSHFIPRAGQIFGYGAISPWGQVLSDVLRFVDVNVVASNQQCEDDLQLELDPSMFCAGGQAGKDACDGDSGGPLVVAMDAEETANVALLGVISFGRGCGVQFLPGVYANVSQGDEFINEIAQDVAWTSDKSIVATPAPGFQDGENADNGLTGTPTSSPSRAPEVTGSASPSTGAETPTARPTDANSSPATTRDEFTLPSDLSPAVKDAVVDFLLGANGNIASPSIEELFQSSDLVFKSSQSLASVLAVITTYDQKTLHQRKTSSSGTRKVVTKRQANLLCGSDFRHASLCASRRTSTTHLSPALAVAAMPLPPASSTSRGVPAASKPKKKKKLKYHERPAFLRTESILELKERGSAYAQESRPNAPSWLGRGDSESYRLAATLHRSAQKAALQTRPFSWGYGSADGALGHNRTTRVEPMKTVAAFRRGAVRSISAGNRLSLFLTDAGDMYQCGRLHMTQDGRGMWEPRKVHFELAPRLVAVAAGHLAAYALDTQGQVYSWGTQCFGQLGFEEAMESGLDRVDEGTNQSDGIETPTERDKDKATDSEDDEDDDANTPPPHVVVVHKLPRLMSGLDGVKVTKLAAGNHFALAVSATGHLFSWGRGNCGQLGLGGVKDVAIPARIDALADWIAVDVACGHSHALGIFSAWDYTVVYAWGTVCDDRLGLGLNAGHAHELSPREVTFFRGLNATQVAAGHDHSLVLCGVPASHSFLYGFGGNQHGQLGIVTPEDHVAMPSYISEFANVRVARIGAGARCSVVLTGDGELFTWGDAMFGKAGHGRTTFTPWRLELPDSIDRASGALWKGDYVTQVSMGSHHALGLLRTHRDDMDRWQKFPLGPLASHLHPDEGVDASSPSSVCVCEASQSTTSSVFGVFVGCDTCSAAPICCHCARRCHHQHMLQPVALGTRQQQVAQQCACAKTAKAAAKAEDNGDTTDSKPPAGYAFAARPMRIQEDELLVLPTTKNRKARVASQQATVESTTRKSAHAAE